MKKRPYVYIALPVLNESEYLPQMIDCLSGQDYPDFKIVACVNNYDHWWDDPEKGEWCLDNQKSIEFLKKMNGLEIILIDKSSKGKGWPEKKGGVGSARKIIMDFITGKAGKHDLIVSMDADTCYPENYISAITEQFRLYPNLFGLALPYYHKLDGNETDRLILRYEIYMRNYLINMIRIKNPYAFTALGSAMASPVWAYQTVGGLTPVKSGEDFYFLQKLAKSGKIGLWAETTAYPSSRFSERVIFGTGPALIKGNQGYWDNYPVYEYSSFDKVRETFDLFADLYINDLETPMDGFLKNIFKTTDLWEKIRENYKDRENFIRACAVKIDALRILQFLRLEQQQSGKDSETILVEYIHRFFENDPDESLKQIITHLDFIGQPIGELNKIRDFLFHQENRMRKDYFAGV